MIPSSELVWNVAVYLACSLRLLLPTTEATQRQCILMLEQIKPIYAYISLHPLLYDCSTMMEYKCDAAFRKILTEGK